MFILFWFFCCSVISVYLLIQFGIDCGFGLEQCLVGSGLDICLFGDFFGEIDVVQELSVVCNLVWYLGDVCVLGLVVGLCYYFNVYGIWGFVLFSSLIFFSVV